MIEAEPSNFNWTTVNRLMNEAVGDAVFPGAVLLVSVHRRRYFLKGYGHTDRHRRQKVLPETIYDLASLTKPLSTTLAVMRLIGQGRLALEQTVASILAPFDRDPHKAITIAQLLSHCAGFAAWRPFYRQLERIKPGLRRHRLRELLAAEQLEDPPGSKMVYSDLGFMVLTWIIETITRTGLDRFVTDEIYRPLGIGDLYYIPNGATPPPGDYAVTEDCPWRGHSIKAEVHDENAYAAGGVAGQAGLFGTAAGVAQLLHILLALYHGDTDTHLSAAQLLRPDLVRLFFARYAKTERALGFDCPTGPNSSSGRFFSYRSIGHLGFTGTSFWIDLARELVVILLTNRVHPSRTNIKIRQFRPQIHDAILNTLQFAQPG